MTSKPFESRRTVLLPPQQDLIDTLYAHATFGTVTWAWPEPAQTPSTFAATLFDGVVAQFAIVDKRNGHQMGLASATHYNELHRHMNATVAILPEYQGRIWPLQGVVLFLHYLFVRFGLRNIYAAVPAREYAKLRTGDGCYFDVEGVQKERLMLDGDFEDLYLIVFSRVRWMANADRILYRCTR